MAATDGVDGGACDDGSAGMVAWSSVVNRASDLLHQRRHLFTHHPEAAATQPLKDDWYWPSPFEARFRSHSG
jgi:hypothetical protein